MFMCTKEYDSRTDIELTLDRKSLTRRSSRAEVEQPRATNVKRIPVTFRTEDTIYINSENSPSPSKKISDSDYIVHQFFNAIYKGNITYISQVMKYIRRNIRDSSGRSPTIAALFLDNEKKRRYLLQVFSKIESNLKCVDSTFHRDAIAWACLFGLAEEVSFLIDQCEGDVDYLSKDVEGNTYLHLAVTSSNFMTVYVVVKRMKHFRLPVDTPNKMGLTPYILARKLGLKECAQLIGTKGNASLDRRDDRYFLSPREWSILGQRERRYKMFNNSRNPAKRVPPKVSKKVEREEREKRENNHGARKMSDNTKTVLHRYFDMWTEQRNESSPVPSLDLEC